MLVPPTSRLTLCGLLALSLAGCDGRDDAQTPVLAPVTAPADTATGVSGLVAFTQNGDVLTIEVVLTGLTSGAHGFHVHTAGDCGRGDHDDDGFAEVAGAAMGHYDPYGTADHGSPEDPDDRRHVGDFGNVVAGSDGRATATITTQDVSLGGERSVLGRAVVVHASRDDLESDPGGMAGDRVGCGVIPTSLGTEE